MMKIPNPFHLNLGERMWQHESGHGPQRLAKSDILAVGVGVVLDGIIEFLRRLHALELELNNPPEDSGTHRDDGNQTR